MNNRFIIIIGSYNNSKWVDSNLDSVICQDYSNYEVLYFNDASEDNTLDLVNAKVGNNPKFHIHSVSNRKYKTWFFFNFDKEEYIHDNDILVFLDGDDMLSSENVLTYLNSIYSSSNCWMTYGGMQVWDGINLYDPYPQNSEIPQSVIDNRLFRKDIWRTSHLKSMRGFLWKKFDKNDLIPDDKFGPCQDDLAIMFAMLEMCPPNKVYRIVDPIYIYNGSSQNGGSRGCTELKNKHYLEQRIRVRVPYENISFVTPTLSGGLGNQMFEIATAASLAKDNNATIIINPDEHILPNQGNNVNSYVENIFSRIMMDSSIIPNYIYSQPISSYEKIKYAPNLKLNGHFQSWKYFDHNKIYIRKLFSPTTSIQKKLNDEFKWLEDYTAIQVRRGDYIKFPDHHPLLPVEYFINAVESANPERLIIFSDDYTWCHKNLQFKNISCEYRLEHDSDYMELYMMSLCKNLIISNSSFGWWAAYLNTHPNKKIYAPLQWFGSAIISSGFNIDDLLIPDWNRITI